MAFKEIAPGVKTGGESNTQPNSETGSPGPGTSYYPSATSGGYATGGEADSAGSKGSSVPARPNAQGGNLAGEKASIKAAAQECANYGGHNQDFNPTGSSLSSPEGERTSEDDGFYGSRPASSPGTNAGGTGDSVRAQATDPYDVEEGGDSEGEA